ncbi:MAG: TIR domain-containing protein [Planctomycetota bacterium]
MAKVWRTSGARPRVVVLWYGPQEPLVRPLLRDLETAGFDPWEHARDGMPGDAAFPQIRGAIVQSAVTFVCVDDDVLARPWFAEESGMVRALEPRLWLLRTGPVTEDRLPAAYRDAHTFDLTLDDPATRRARLLQNLADVLGRAAPRIVTAWVAAMRRDEYDGWAKGGLPAEVLAACRGLGLEDDDVPSLLRARYREDRGSFCPFGDDRGLASLVDIAVDRVRQTGARPTVVVRWIDDDSWDDDDIRTAWEERDSLLIVDAVSVFHDTVHQLLGGLPVMVDPNRRATLWLPPYTRLTGAAEQATALEALAKAGDAQLGDLFRRWRDGKHLPWRQVLGFGFELPAALECWLHQALEVATAASQPHPDAVAQVEQDGAGPSLLQMGAS